MLPQQKTKIVCTIGPASESKETLEQMLFAGMNIARLNFSHGDFSWHEQIIARLRKASDSVQKRLAIMADLPGPKIRLGQFSEEPIILAQGDGFTLTTHEIMGDATRAFVNFPNLPDVVKPGDRISLNDGIVHLEVLERKQNDIHCHVLVGGELRSRKGVNLPGIDLGISAFTEHDHECLKFALEHGVDAISQSFVAGPEDINTVRRAAAALGHHPFIIAKIERSQALSNVDAIIRATDGVMIARGDLGVEIPIEQIAIVQKQLTRSANILGKPVITATQMLESMVSHFRPTRAEVTDTANAILDGTDCVMLSEESAMGKYPIQAVEMLSRIATATEPHRGIAAAWEADIAYGGTKDLDLPDFISRNVNHAVDHLHPSAVIVPTASGHSARMISRFKLPVWVAAVSPDESVCQGLAFSYGVCAVCKRVPASEWDGFARTWVRENRLPEGLLILLQGPSPEHPEANPSLEILTLVTDSGKSNAAGAASWRTDEKEAL